MTTLRDTRCPLQLPHPGSRLWSTTAYTKFRTGPRQPLEWRGDSEPTDARIPLTNDATDGLALKGTNLPAALISTYRSVLDPDGDGTVDLSGGFHDAGDHVKFGLPQAYSASTLAWGLYEFTDSYIATGTHEHLMDQLYWFNDYFLRSTFRDSSGKVIAFNYMVGRGGVDHTFWGPPELQDAAKYPRPATFAYPSGTGWSAAPASDQAAQAAAALTIMSLIVKETDSEYATTCLDTAKALYTFARDGRGLGNGDGFYPSASDADDLSWAAVWLYEATRTPGYLTDITARGPDGAYSGYLKAIITSTQSTWQNIWVHSWDSVWGGVFAKLAPLSTGVVPDADNAEYWYYFRWNCEYWTGGAVKHSAPAGDSHYIATTPAGFSVVATWGSARYNTAAQLQALVYRKYGAQDPQGSADLGVRLSQWALSQMNYVMGDNPLHRSFIVGFTATDRDTFAQHPHHRAAHGSTTNNMNVPEKHRHTLWGALVGGPDSGDEHNDVTTDYVLNEVAVDYNAGFVGALAGLWRYFGGSQDIVRWTPPAEPAENPFTIRAKLEQESRERSQVTLQIANYATHPPRLADTLSARYYFSISELMEKGQGIDDVTVATYYDQSGVNGTGVTATISEPVAADAARGLYYVTVSWRGVAFFGTLDYHFGLVAGLDSGWTANWDGGNDYSRSGLGGEFTDTRRIPVYEDGRLVYGEEPVVATPSPSGTVTSTPTPTARTCTATYTVSDQWDSGFQAGIVVKNSGSGSIKGWTITWTVPSGEKVTQVWGGTLTASGATATVTSASWNAALSAGASTSVGLMGSKGPGVAVVPQVACSAS
jgi:endoglucanase